MLCYSNQFITFQPLYSPAFFSLCHRTPYLSLKFEPNSLFNGGGGIDCSPPDFDA